MLKMRLSCLHIQHDLVDLDIGEDNAERLEGPKPDFGIDVAEIFDQVTDQTLTFQRSQNSPLNPIGVGIIGSNLENCGDDFTGFLVPQIFAQDVQDVSLIHDDLEEFFVA